MTGYHKVAQILFKVFKFTLYSIFKVKYQLIVPRIDKTKNADEINNLGNNSYYTLYTTYSQRKTENGDRKVYRPFV